MKEQFKLKVTILPEDRNCAYHDPENCALATAIKRMMVTPQRVGVDCRSVAIPADGDQIRIDNFEYRSVNFVKNGNRIPVFHDDEFKGRSFRWNLRSFKKFQEDESIEKAEVVLLMKNEDNGTIEQIKELFKEEFL